MTPNRMFNPRTGRWTQPDPWFGVHNMQECCLAIGQSSNLFMFALHNPVRWRDPTGLDIRIQGDAAFRDIVMGYLQQITDHQLSLEHVNFNTWRLVIDALAGSDSTLTAGNALILGLVTGRYGDDGARLPLFVTIRPGGIESGFTMNSISGGLIGADGQAGAGSGGVLAFSTSPRRAFTCFVYIRFYHHNMVDELITIGLYGNFHITENMIRAEQGLSPYSLIWRLLPFTRLKIRSPTTCLHVFSRKQNQSVTWCNRLIFCSLPISLQLQMYSCRL